MSHFLSCIDHAVHIMVVEINKVSKTQGRRHGVFEHIFVTEITSWGSECDIIEDSDTTFLVLSF